MQCAISFCPNDTYLFYAWIHQVVGKELPITALFADIEKLNELALSAAIPLIKISFHTFANIAHHYQLLPIGSALGFHCGPKLIAKTPFSLTDLHKKKIAIPGKQTTAHLLLDRLNLIPKEKHFCLYHEIMPLIECGTVDCGLIIHESRFTFKPQFVEIADLGLLWHTQTQLPLPLGGIAIARDIPSSHKQTIVSILQSSLAFARKFPNKALPFILQAAQEKKTAVVKKHIQTYVNCETEKLSQKGILAIQTLLNGSLLHDWLYTS